MKKNTIHHNIPTPTEIRHSYYSKIDGSKNYLTRSLCVLFLRSNSGWDHFSTEQAKLLDANLLLSC